MISLWGFVQFDKFYSEVSSLSAVITTRYCYIFYDASL